MSGFCFPHERQGPRGAGEACNPQDLEDSLVSEAEDPRIHCQRILTRALIADSLWPNRFQELIDAELRFGVVLTWLLNQLENGRDRNKLLDGMSPSEAGDLAVPPMVRETYRWLQSETCPVPDYISAALLSRNREAPNRLLFEPALDTFSHLWRAALAEDEAERLRVVEPGCGSANAYGFLHSFGLAAHCEYVGFDCCAETVARAKQQWPGGDFFIGSLCHPGLADQSFDYLYVHDVLEHLPVEDLEGALAEVMRIVRNEAWLHFCSTTDLEEHQVRFQGAHHWNTLSVAQVARTLRDHGAEVTVIRIPQFVQDKFGFKGYVNPQAMTLLASKSHG